MRYWHDLEPGQKFSTDTATLSKQDILEFAAEFDPQPYHLDNASADESIFGGLCASGWQVCALLNRLISDTFSEQDIAFIGIQSVPQQRWKIPVFANSTLSANIEITECNPITDDKELGTICCNIDVFNQDNTQVMNQQSVLLIARNEVEGAVR